MSVRLIPLDAGAQFPPGRLDEIIGYLATSLSDVIAPIAVDKVDVVVAPTNRPVKGWDVNGFAMGDHWVVLGVDPDCAGREKSPLAIQLRAVLAHELHHAKRGQGPRYGRTLGEALISEGLAQCYEEEVGCPTPNYATAVKKESNWTDLHRRRSAKPRHPSMTIRNGSMEARSIPPFPGVAATVWDMPWSDNGFWRAN